MVRIHGKTQISHHLEMRKNSSSRWGKDVLVGNLEGTTIKSCQNLGYNDVAQIFTFNRTFARGRHLTATTKILQFVFVFFSDAN